MRNLLSVFFGGLILLAIHFPASAATATPAAPTPAAATTAPAAPTPAAVTAAPAAPTPAATTTAPAAPAPTATTVPAAATAPTMTSNSPSPPPLTAFASSPALRDVDLSPGGKMFAWLDTTHGDQRIVLFDLTAKKELRTLVIDPQMIFHWLTWSDDSTLLYSVGLTETVALRTKASANLKHTYSRVFATSVSDPTPRMLLSMNTNTLFAYNTQIHVMRAQIDKPNTVVVSAGDTVTISQQKHTDVPGHAPYDAFAAVVYEVDTHTGKGTPVEYGDPYTHNWFYDLNGKILGRCEWYWDTQTSSIQVRQGSLWHEIYKIKQPTALNIAGFDRNHGAVLTLQKDTDGRIKLWAIPLDGSPRSVVFQDPNWDIESVFFEPVTRALEGVYLADPSHKIVWIDKDEEKRLAILIRSFPRQRILTLSESADRRLLAFRVNGPSHPPTYYLLDTTTNQASVIGSEYPGLDGVKLGQVKAFTYKAHDGTSIPAFLTLPPGTPPGPLPLIVLPHGGPAARDGDTEFEWLRQYFATRGYAVFQPQFRGSSGYGDEFFLAGKRQWGLLMQDDVTDGVHVLIDQGQADPQRVCIVGYSYGSGYAGYAALAGATFTPDLYKCAISVNGISDLPRFMGYEIEHEGATSDTVAYWREYLGEHSDPTLADRSPDRNAEHITKPVLLIYSADDVIVPANQSQLLAESLQKLGRNVQLVEIPSADHALSQPGARLRAMEEIEKFLQNHL